MNRLFDGRLASVQFDRVTDGRVVRKTGHDDTRHVGSGNVGSPACRFKCGRNPARPVLIRQTRGPEDRGVEG